MFYAAYEKMVTFASKGQLADELPLAREEYVRRTGDLFESDESFERRISSFLEWYVLDRGVSYADHLAPARIYIDSLRDELTTPEHTELQQITRTVLSLFEYRGVKAEKLRVKDLLSNEKLDVFERRAPAGLNAGDIIEARLVPGTERSMFSPAIAVHPPGAKKAIQKAAKRLRKSKAAGGRIDLVHRVAYLANRCERYGHVDPREIFTELET